MFSFTGIHRWFSPDYLELAGLGIDGVAKTHQLLRCCNCSRHCGVPEYASLLDNCAPCIWRFLLSHSLFGFLAKAWGKNLMRKRGNGPIPGESMPARLTAFLHYIQKSVPENQFFNLKGAAVAKTS
jgi:hypothetical protein